VILAHHGYGEEIVLAVLAGGGTSVAGAVALAGRAKLATMLRWLRRR
jgi:hypothetical protein